MTSPGKAGSPGTPNRILDRIKLWEDKKKPTHPSTTVTPAVAPPASASKPIPTSSGKASLSVSPPNPSSGGSGSSPSHSASPTRSEAAVPATGLSGSKSFSDLPSLERSSGSHIKTKSTDTLQVPMPSRSLSASANDQPVLTAPSSPAQRKANLSTSMDDKDKADRETKRKVEEEKEQQRRKEKKEEEERKKREKDEEDRRKKEEEERRKREKEEEEKRRKREEEERRKREKEEEERKKREKREREKEEEEKRRKEREAEEEKRKRAEEERRKEKERERKEEEERREREKREEEERRKREKEEEEKVKREKKERKEREKHSKTVEFAPTPEPTPNKTRSGSKSGAPPLALSQSLLDTIPVPTAMSPASPNLNALLSPRANTPLEGTSPPTATQLRQMVDEGRRVAAEMKASNSSDHESYQKEVEDLAKRLETALRREREEEERKEEEARQAAEVERQAARKKELELLEANVQKATEEHSKRLSMKREKLTEAEKKRRMQALEEQFQRIQSKKAMDADDMSPVKSKTSRAKTLNPAKLKKMAKAFDDRVVQSVPKPTDITLEEHFIFDSKGRPNYELMKNHFLKEGRIEHGACRRLIEGARRHFEKEPNILELQAPCVMVGDLHGQFYDLVTLMKKAGSPTNTQFLFLGDYVDRGCFSCEVVFLLFACKIAHPKSFWMLRGNHESRTLTNHYNFKRECYRKYGRDVYNDIMHCFDRLPIAATIDGAKGRILALHGGLSPFLHDLEDIRALDRVQDVPETGSFCDLLWSDPVEEPTQPFRTDREFKRYREVTFDSNHSRGCSYVFGHQYAMEFVRDNKLLLVVRAHEVMKEGYKKHWFGKEDRIDPLVITVFSAPNYCDKYGNLGAFMRYEGPSYKFESYKHEEHPYWLPAFQNAVTYTMPFISENATKIFSHLLAVLAEDEEDDEISQSIKKKLAYMRRASILFGEIRQNKQAELQKETAVLSGAGAFDTVAASDAKNERRPLVRKPRRERGKMSRTTSGHF